MIRGGAVSEAGDSSPLASLYSLQAGYGWAPGLLLSHPVLREAAAAEQQQSEGQSEGPSQQLLLAALNNVVR